MEEHIIADRTLIKTARIVSAVFTPFSIPFVAFLILFLFSYLNIMPLAYKLIVLGVVYCFTILILTPNHLPAPVNGLKRRSYRWKNVMYLSANHHHVSACWWWKLYTTVHVSGIMLTATLMLISYYTELEMESGEHMPGMVALWRWNIFQRLFGYNRCGGYPCFIYCRSAEF